MHNARGLWLVALAAVLWGTSGVAAALSQLPPDGTGAAVLGAARSLIGGALLAGFFAFTSWRAGAHPLAALRGARHVRDLGLSVASLALFQWSFFGAVAQIGSAETALISTALAPLAARVWERGPLGARGWLQVGAGVASLLSAAGHTPVGEAMSGTLLASISAATYASYTRFTARLEQETGAGLGITALALLGAGLSLLPWAADAQGAVYTARAAWACAYLGVFTVSLPYFLFVHGLRSVTPSAALTLLAIQPLTAAALDWLWLGRTLSFAHVPALGLMITAAAIRSQPERTKENSPCPNAP